MTEENVVKVLKRADELSEMLKTAPAAEKYERGVNALLTANAALFITLVWKAHDSAQGISIAAKVALIFFAIGSIAIIARYIIDYLSDGLDRTPIIDEAAVFFKKHKETLRAGRPRQYRAWELNASFSDWIDGFLRKCCGGNRPALELVIAGCSIVDMIFVAMSSVALAFGVGFLIFAAL